MGIKPGHINFSTNISLYIISSLVCFLLAGDYEKIIYVHDSRIVYEISKESISQMLQILDHVVYEILDDDDLEFNYK